MTLASAPMGFPTLTSSTMTAAGLDDGVLDVLDVLLVVPDVFPVLYQASGATDTWMGLLLTRLSGRKERLCFDNL